MKFTSPSYIVFILALAVLATSCARKQTEERLVDPESIFLEEDSALAADTVAAEKEKPHPEATTEAVLAYIENSPDKERFEQGIIPQMARDVPEYAAKLVVNEHDGFLIVDKNTMKIYRYNRYGIEMERVGMACSKKYGTKHKRRDNRTPEGYFTIQGIYDSTDWLYTDDDGKTSKIKGQFGPRFMRLATPVSSQIGIHGTCAPWSIGGRRSHGCIRILNENILRFAEICKPGWPVIVSPGKKDIRVNLEEGYDIPTVAVAVGHKRCSLSRTSEETAKPAETVSSPTDSVVSPPPAGPAPADAAAEQTPAIEPHATDSLP